jgi:arsenical pump membrane protein
MVLAELARKEGLFDYFAAQAARHANGSARRLFLLVYCVGTLVTVFMSNDATAVVLTPAVLAVAKAAKARNPLPYLFICAFIANAASFVLPISNPANLVIFGDHMPTLTAWLGRFGLASLVSIVATYFVLRFTQRASLQHAIECQIDVPALSAAGKTAGYGIALMAIVLLLASACDVPLGWPTFAAGMVAFAAVCLRKRSLLYGHIRHISWQVLPLVAGLFVLVEGIQRTGALSALGTAVATLQQHSPAGSVWAAGFAVALASNLINNLPAGLMAGSVMAAGHLPDQVANAVLIGVDLGPNLSVTGSLATILWLTALRRDGVHVGGWAFFKLGMVVMLPALALCIGALFV